MPFGISRFAAPVVSLVMLMPLVPAGAQEPAKQAAQTSLTVVEARGDFVIRSSARPRTPPQGVQLGRSIRLDRALLAPSAPPITKANEEGSHEAR
jgi:hypothetical protein